MIRWFDWLGFRVCVWRVGDAPAGPLLFLARQLGWASEPCMCEYIPGGELQFVAGEVVHECCELFGGVGRRCSIFYGDGSGEECGFSGYKMRRD